MSPGERELMLKTINDLLGVQPRPTHDGAHLKCLIPDQDDGGFCKAYLDRSECQALAFAFGGLATTLNEGEEKT